MMAGFYGVPTRERRTDEILDALGLGDKKPRLCPPALRRHEAPADGGQGHRPHPAGPDPRRAHRRRRRRTAPLLWEYVRKLNANGVTIVLTTHYLEEAQEICDTIAIINHGQVAACEPTPKLLRRSTTRRWWSVPKPRSAPSPPPSPAWTPPSARTGNLLSPIKRTPSPSNNSSPSSANSNVKIGDLATEEPDLEDVFVALTSG